MGLKTRHFHRVSKGFNSRVDFLDEEDASIYIFISCLMLNQPEWEEVDSYQGVENTNWCDSVVLSNIVQCHAGFGSYSPSAFSFFFGSVHTLT